ncbi:MAG: PIN domain-containing protein [Anaerolineales bacterium]
MKQHFVLDAWAFLALLQAEEPAASRVKQLLSGAQKNALDLCVSVINLGEVIYRIGRVKDEDEAWKTLDQLRNLPLTVIPATEDAVFAAVDFKIHYTISYADAFAAATADELGAVLVTGDPELLQLGDRVRIERLKRDLD